MHRTFRRSLLAGLALTTTVVMTLTAAPFAEANVASNYLVSSTLNTSDPSAIPCFDLATNFHGVCLYTSHDLATGQKAPDGGAFPMDGTYLFTLADGQDPTVQSNWVARGQVLSEGNQYASWANGHQHLWAPEAAQVGSDTFLYVPDTTIASKALSSKIGVSKAPSPWGTFSYLGQLNTDFTAKKGATNIPMTYASDPSPVQDMSGTRWMVWATGDGTNCGGLAVGHLNQDMTHIDGSPHEISITGWPSSAKNCSRTDAVHPYLEGATMYWSTPWAGSPGQFTLLFSVSMSGGNEAIAYATASDPDGVFTFRGIVMDPSSTDYTNQATIVDNPAFSDGRKMFLYHDGPLGTKQRKVHAECLPLNGSIPKVVRTPSNSNSENNFYNCAAPPPTNCPATVANHGLGGGQFGAMWATNNTLTRAFYTGVKGTTCTYSGLIHTSAGGIETVKAGTWTAILSAI